MFIKDIKAFFKQFQCGKCKRCFDQVCNLDKHIKICEGVKVKYEWKGGVYKVPKSIKQQLADFDIDTTNHDFLFPNIIVFDTEASLPTCVEQPAVKKKKMCNGVNGESVACDLKFTSTHQLLSYSFAINFPGVEHEYFACRQGDSESDVNELVEKFLISY